MKTALMNNNINEFVDQIKFIKNVIGRGEDFSEKDLESVKENLKTIKENIERLIKEATPKS